MDFALFLLLNAVLFIRPAEIFVALDQIPLYLILMLANLAVSGLRMVSRLNPNSLRDDPISAAVLGILAAIVLSHLSHLDLDRAWEGFTDFGKVVLYYFLFTVVINSPARLRSYLGWIVAFALILTTIAMLEYHGYVDFPAVEPVGDNEIDPESGQTVTVYRLCSSGIYNDPNDLCLILLMGMLCCVYAATDRSRGLLRVAWLAPIGVFGYALMLTHSRGGFLAMIGSVAVLAEARFGWRRALPLLFIAIPAFVVLFAGRQTNISTSDDTGQDRIQLWSAGLDLFRRSPLFGSGWGTYAEEVGLVAHNSFVHGFAELGLFGGALFLNAFLEGVLAIRRLAGRDAEIGDPGLRHLRPYLLAMISAYCFGSLTISRNYVVPTYMTLGLASCYPRLVGEWSPRLGNPIPCVSPALAARWLGSALACIVAIYLFVRVFARWG